MPARVRFGPFEFDATTGDLRRLDGSASSARLPPQPARLLALLLDRNGGLVLREEIRAALWPDAHVDFDASLHFCVRQVREALGDSAAEPRYIRTVPRRGYQLMTPVVAVESPGPDATGTGALRPSVPRGRAIAIAIAVAVTTVVVAIGWARLEPADALPLRVAVMPFRPPDTSAAVWPPIAEWILEELDRTGGDAVALVGPTSTSSYPPTPAALARMATDYRVDYVLNGRFLDEQPPRMLAELIRVSDGTHVWVRSFAPPDDGRRLGLGIGREAAAALGLGEGPP